MTRELFINYLRGNCSEEDFDKLILWIKEESTSKSGIDLVHEVWEGFEPEEGSLDQVKFNQLLDKIHQQINLSSNTRQSSLRNNTRDWKRIFSFLTKAAAILLLPVLSLLIFIAHSAKEQYAQNANELVVTAPVGATMNFELGDGTKVWLNHGSKLKFPYRFNGYSRRVLLTGEAFFLVAPNKEVPFIVETGNIVVKATGTAFNVSGYSEDDFVETTLVEGSVILCDIADSKELRTLYPSECLKFNKKNNNYSVESGKTIRNSAWKDGRLVFRNDSLEIIARKLERWFNVEVEITSENVKNFTYTATFTNETLTQILDLMSIPTPVSYKMNEVRKLPDGSFSKQKVLIGMKKSANPRI